MKIRGFLLTALSLAFSAGISASDAQGETYRAQRQSIAAIAPTLGVNQSEDLANLAADLARTAARLAEVQQAQQTEARQRSPSRYRANQSSGNIEPVRRLTSTRSDTGTTVRWLGSNANSSYQSNRGDESLAARRNQTLRRLPTAEASQTNSQVVRAQASEEVFYSDQTLHEEIIPRVAPEPADAGNSNTGPTADWKNPTYVNDSCCGPSCDVVTCLPPRPCRRRTIVMGTEAVFLSPNLNGQSSSFVFEDFTVPSYYNYSPGSSSINGAGLDDFYVAPRLWLGVQGQCWGVVGRYFHLRAGENDYDPYFPSTFDQGYDVNSVFEAYYTDLEVTRNFCLNGSKNQFTFGARYASIEHSESVIAMAQVAEGLINGGARSNRQAHGTGLTFGLNGRKPLFCNSCANWFYRVRSSILWGNTTNSVETWSEAILTDPSAIAIAGSKNGAIAQLDDDLFIGEVQLGLEWNFAMRCLPAKSFFRMAFEYQYWDGGAGRAASTSFSGFEVSSVGTAQGTATADAPGIRADLIGFSVGTGFTW